jgi:hypothetical protein
MASFGVARRRRRAQDAFARGERRLLFSGELVEDIPPAVRRWLSERGLLPPALADPTGAG